MHEKQFFEQEFFCRIIAGGFLNNLMREISELKQLTSAFFIINKVVVEQ